MSLRFWVISTLGFQFVVLFGMCRRCGLVGKKYISLDVGFEGLKTDAFPACSLCFLIVFRDINLQVLLLATMPSWTLITSEL